MPRATRPIWLTNLFRPLHADTLAEFKAGSGDELGATGRRGKMLALHSSSALTVNFFDYWQSVGLKNVREALSLDQDVVAMRFEAQFPTGLQGNPPNLDLALTLTDGSLVAVECKFTEPFSASKSAEPFKAKYFPADRGLWSSLGLSACQSAAERLQRGELRFNHLNASQLLKHILGLAQQPAKRFALIYLFYSPLGDEGVAHSAEVEDFAVQIGAEVDFRWSTYQAAFDRIRTSLTGEHSAYGKYMAERYLSGAQ